MKINKFVFKYLYINLILLILNLYLKSNSKNNIFKKFKIVDKAFISFCKKTFKEISFEINKKYYRKYKLLNNLFINQQNFEKNRTISLYIEDNQGLPLNYIINLLKRKYYVK
jgi:ABC-type long-subunit fatty acid transport system fused permease/ATPase subunit